MQPAKSGVSLRYKTYVGQEWTTASADDIYFADAATVLRSAASMTHLGPPWLLPVEDSMTETEINQRFSDKVRRGIFNPVARFLTNLSTAEDELQDAIAQTWLMFRRYVMAKGRVLDDGILIHSCRQRAVDLGRRFVGNNRATCRKQDVLDPRAYRDGHVEVLRLDSTPGDDAAARDAMAVGWAETLAANPSRSCGPRMTC